MDNSIPFPQADDIEKIIKLIGVSNESDLLDSDYLSIFLDDIGSRQVSYYLNAAAYLGIISKERLFTERGLKLRNSDSFSRIQELIRIILSDEIFGTVFIYQHMTNTKLTNRDIREVIQKYYSDYSDAIYLRRAQTVSKWVDWINNTLNLF